MSWRRACLVIAALWAFVVCRSQWTSAASCYGANPAIFTENYCYIAHYECRDSFSADAFAARFGPDVETCTTLSHDFVSQVLARVTDDPAPNVGDPELDNCMRALDRVSCAELVTDALLDPGRPCNPDVIAGVAMTTELYPRESCPNGHTGGGCRMGD